MSVVLTSGDLGCYGIILLSGCRNIQDVRAALGRHLAFTFQGTTSADVVIRCLARLLHASAPVYLSQPRMSTNSYLLHVCLAYDTCEALPLKLQCDHRNMVAV